jgi:hypothetical protein
MDSKGCILSARSGFVERKSKVLNSRDVWHFATAYDGDWDPYIDDFATKNRPNGTSSSPRAKAGRGFAAHR